MGWPRTRRAGAAAILALLAVAATYLLVERDGGDALPLEPAPTVPTAEGVVGDAGATVEPPPADAPPAAPAPRIDVVRIDAAGGAVVAGNAQGAEEVVLRVDGEPVSTVAADGEGNFVAMLDIPLTTAPRLLSLEARDASGTVTRAPEDVIVAPARPLLPEEASARSAATTPGDMAGLPGDVAGLPGDVPVPPASSDASRAEPVSRAAPGEAEVLSARSPTISNASSATSGAASPSTTPPSTTPPAADAPGPVAVDGMPEAQDAPSAPGSLDLAAVPPESVPVAAAPGAPPRLFRAGPNGVRPIEAAPPPEAAETLGLDAISYDASGDVRLTGRAAPDEALRIYLDDAPVQTARAGADGTWTSSLPDIRSGVYTLRVDAVDAGGDVTARVETPFQRSAPEVAAAARRDGLTAITVQPGYTLWAISRGWFGEGVRYVQIFEANRGQIRDPNLIYPGQVVALPNDGLSLR